MFRSSRLYAWTDPGTDDGNPSNQNCSSPTANCTIAVTDISGQNLFNIDAWAQKIAYGTQDAPDAILAGGPLPAFLVSQYGTYVCGPGMRWRGLILKIAGTFVQASQMT